DAVSLVAWRGDLRLPNATPVEVTLNQRIVQRQPGRAALNDDTERGSMLLPPGRNPKRASERAAHALPCRFPSEINRAAVSSTRVYSVVVRRPPTKSIRLVQLPAACVPRLRAQPHPLRAGASQLHDRP